MLLDTGHLLRGEKGIYSFRQSAESDCNFRGNSTEGLALSQVPFPLNFEMPSARNTFNEHYVDMKIDYTNL